MNRFILHGFRPFRLGADPYRFLCIRHAAYGAIRCFLQAQPCGRGAARHHAKDDVPGSLAPAIYFQYLADGNPSRCLAYFSIMRRICSRLLVLAIRFGHFLDGDLVASMPLPDEAEELLRTGLWLENMGKSELAEPLFARLAEDEGMSAEMLVPAGGTRQEMWKLARALCYCGRRLCMLSGVFGLAGL